MLLLLDHELVLNPGLLLAELVLLEHALADDTGQQRDHAEAAEDDEDGLGDSKSLDLYIFCAVLRGFVVSANLPNTCWLVYD